MLVVSSCAVIQSESSRKIALLAPFEGRYREIGYNALYAVRLAIRHSGVQDIDLLAVDDGGTVTTALERIQALNIDPTVEVIITLGQFASHPDVQQANDKPLVIVGYWGHDISDDDTLMTVNPTLINATTDIQDIIGLDTNEQLIGNDLLMLEQIPILYDDLSHIEILSSGTLPDINFREQYMNSDLFVPEPNVLATLTYDFSRFIVEAIQTHTPLAETSFSSINGTIQLTDGYWQDAPIYRYRYDNNRLININN